jgi:PadR family transcriptional regulator, regulatory protein PadR
MPEQDPRMTLATLRLLRVFMEDPSQPIYGLELLKAVKSSSGTVYPILGRLERADWIAGEWEEIDPTIEQRPRRRFYRLTAVGELRAQQELDDLLIAVRPTRSRVSWRPAPQGAGG